MNRSTLAILVLAAAASAQTYTVSPFGPACGASLQGVVVQPPIGVAMRVAVTGADPFAHAVLVLGPQLPAPVALPGGCDLLVDPRVVLHTRTNGNGDAGFVFRLPPVVPITIDLQALVVRRTPSGRVADTSNGLRVVGT
jgi:hypothetical protein